MRTVATALLAAAALASPALAVPNGPAETGLDKCQNTVRAEAVKYAQATQKAIATCLGKVSTEIVKKNAGSVAGAVTACTAQFNKIGRPDGKSLSSKFYFKVLDRCAPAPFRHIVDDLMGTPAPNVAEPLGVSINLAQFCSRFGIPGSVDSAEDWILCMRSAQDCAVRLALAAEFPRAIEWLNALATEMPPSGARNAVVALEAAMDGASDDDLPDLQCGSTCGDGVKAATEQCDGADLGGASCESLGYASGTLGCDPATCGFDTSACVPAAPSSCGNGTIESPEQCDGADLGGATCTSLGYTLGGALACGAGCAFDTSGCASQAFLATGQTTCWGGDLNSPVPIPCAGTGQDGETQSGAPLAYVDNGDGTISDPNTGLMWEKKSDDGSLNDKDRCHPWAGRCSGDGVTLCGRDVDCSGPGGTCDLPVGDCQTGPPGGLTVFEWVDQLNAASFAGYTDWRLPNRRELESIVDLERVVPSVSGAFNSNCGANSSGNPGCTVTTCSCTRPHLHWSSSSYAFNPIAAWFVSFQTGLVSTNGKDGGHLYVRAVRGGS